MKFDTQTTLFIVLGILVLFGGYWFFFTGDDNEPPLTATLETTQSQTRFKVLVSQLTPISFDTAIFADPAFMALTNLATPLTAEPTGRIDPFAAVSVSGTSGT